MGEILGDELSERVCERLDKRFFKMLCKRLCEILDGKMLQVNFRQASSRNQESLNLSHLPSPDEGLVSPSPRCIFS